jgi:NADPH:quinone reductase-like Zn-dependent oxidoreductase
LDEVAEEEHMSDRNIVMAVVDASTAGRLSAIELPIAAPKPGEVRIRVRRAGVAFGDILRGANEFIKIKRYPFVPGYDVSGDVEAMGDGDSNLEMGSRVAAFAPSGGYAQHVTVDARLVLPLPDEVSYDYGAALNINYVTAWQMLTRIARVTRSQKILVTSAAGGVGTALLQLSSELGLKVWGSASASKHDLIRKLGAIPVDAQSIEDTEDLTEVLPEALDVAFEARGPNAAIKTRSLLRPGGLLVLFGFLASAQARASVVIPKVLSLMIIRKGRKFRLYTGNPVKRTGWYREDLRHLIELCAAGALKPEIDSVLPLEEAQAAWERLTDRKVRGKIILDTE